MMPGLTNEVEIEMPSQRLIARMGAVRLRHAVALATVLLVASTLTTSIASSQPTPSSPKPTVILVHGAFADASGWSDEIRHLQKDGCTVLAPANPLRGIASDAA
jgi:pimeloyl-ACP methyl ester carboxylesterase